MKNENLKKLNRSDRQFLWVMAAFALVNWMRYFDRTMSAYNTTPYAFNYSYGLISRGLVGTIWQLLDRLLPWNLMDYRAVYGFNVCLTLVYFLLYFILAAVCLRRVAEEQHRNLYYLLIFLATFLFPEFLGDEMFGRLDLWIFILTFAAVICLIRQKACWIVIPVAMVCTCISQGYVFTNVNLLLALLLYLGFCSKGKKKTYYYSLLILTFLAVSVLFLYFEFFSHSAGTENFDTIVSVAKSLSEDGKSYNESLVNHEILGQGVFEDEMEYHLDNYREFPLCLILFVPYLVMGVRFFIRWIRGNGGEDGRNKKASVVSALISLGFLTILPEMILKVDYGRYVFLTFFYFILLAICLLTMGDSGISESLTATKERIKANNPVPLTVLLYPMLLMPFYDVEISTAIYRLSEILFLRG